MKRVVALLPVLIAFQAGAPPALAWTWPADGPVLRPFVLGDDPYAAAQHRGVDVASPSGGLVRAPASGVVSFAGTVPGGGRTVTIQTADGYSVTLVHLGSIAVERDQTIAEGAGVGSAGRSGQAEHPEPYVHLGVRVTADPNGYVDPLGLLPSRGGPPPASPAPPAEQEPEVPPAPSPVPEAPSVPVPAPQTPAPAPATPGPAAPPAAAPAVRARGRALDRSGRHAGRRGRNGRARRAGCSGAGDGADGAEAPAGVRASGEHRRAACGRPATCAGCHEHRRRRPDGPRPHARRGLRRSRLRRPGLSGVSPPPRRARQHRTRRRCARGAPRPCASSRRTHSRRADG